MARLMVMGPSKDESTLSELGEFLAHCIMVCLVVSVSPSRAVFFAFFMCNIRVQGFFRVFWVVLGNVDTRRRVIRTAFLEKQNLWMCCGMGEMHAVHRFLLTLHVGAFYFYRLMFFRLLIECLKTQNRESKQDLNWIENRNWFFFREIGSNFSVIFPWQLFEGLINFLINFLLFLSKWSVFSFRRHRMSILFLLRFSVGVLRREVWRNEWMVRTYATHWGGGEGRVRPLRWDYCARVFVSVDKMAPIKSVWHHLLSIARVGKAV